ncbi:MAG: hypothetical protein IT326_10525 [Anaerolineae bacterium]|nr:hypothetical protein [Anaerolineae bacterium]
MDINFITDPSLAPQPREHMRVVRVIPNLYPDGQRVWLEIEITPFMPGDRPNLSIDVNRLNGPTVASMSVIETQLTQMSFTIHLREPLPGEYIATVTLYYEPEQVIHTLSHLFEVPASEPADTLTE